jgi:hypothetical protein
MICATLRLVWALVFALGFWGALGGLDWPFLFRLDVLKGLVGLLRVTRCKMASVACCGVLYVLSLVFIFGFST